MRTISPVIAIVLLMLMTVAAGGMAYLTILGYQEQAQEASTGATEHLSSLGKTQIKVEGVSAGKIYLRNLGTEPLRKITVLVEGRPVNVEAPDECEPQQLCVLSIQSNVECTGPCSVQVETATGSSHTYEVEEGDVEARLAPQYSDWSLNTTSILFGESILANITWDKDGSICTLTEGGYWFSNQTITTQEVDEYTWGRWE